MKRMGLYTGKIYDNPQEMNECGMIITDEQSKSENYLKACRLKRIVRCLNCNSCPESQKGINK